jgi:TolA-binding protein
MMGKDQEAATVLDQFVRANPQHPMADKLLFRKGELLYNKKEYQGAIDAYRDLQNRYPKSSLVPESRLWTARSLAALHKTAEAISALREVTAEDPAGAVAPDAFLELGLLAAAAGNTDQALAAFGEVENRFPRREQAIRAGYEKGTVYRNSGNAEGALQQFQSVASAHPGTAFGDRCLVAAGAILLDRKEYPRAEQMFAEVAGRHADAVGAEAQFMVGESRFRQGAYKQAVAALVRIKYLYPSASAWIARAALKMGESYEKLNEPGKAREVYQSIARLNADDELNREERKRLEGLQ